MKAVAIHKYNSIKDIAVVEVAAPKLKEGEILVEVKAFSVNSGDDRMRTLNFSGLPMPSWLIKPLFRLYLGIRKPRKTMGNVFAGVVIEVDQAVENFKVGDKVFGMTGARMGAFAEVVRLSPSHCLALMPKNASFRQAAAIPFGGTTAMHFLRSGGIKTAKKVLIYGSTGAVGSAAVQIAAPAGSEVTAVCGPDGLALSKKLGASIVVNYQEQEISSLAGSYDLIFDAVGHTSKQACTSIMHANSKYVSVIGFDSAKELSTDLEYLRDLYEAGEFAAVIDGLYTLKDIQKAFARVNTGHKKGSVVVTL